MRAMESAPASQPATRRTPQLLRRRVGRIRQKLILLHTVFSIGLATVLLLVIRAPVRDLIHTYEARECVLALQAWAKTPEQAELPADIGIRWGSEADLALPNELASQARESGEIELGMSYAGWPVAVVYDVDARRYVAVAVQSRLAQQAVNRLYLLIIAALLAVYTLIALTLEVFVLPRQVYEPISRLREADAAVQEGVRALELIPEAQIPRDELGEIMRSRNQSILKLREQEQRLEEVLERLEVAASELKRKNHLLETARENLAEQDRLVSLGMVSAGIAHELNTPLAVLKGSVEMISEHPEQGVASDRVALMLRVIRRLEKLSESLLDFARVRPHSMERVPVRGVVEEAWTLVSLDRDARRVDFINDLPEELTAMGDFDRLTQVMVNLLRNATDAMDGRGRIEVASEVTMRDGRAWVSVLVRDNGPGIDPALITRLFEPFATTRLDSKGMGLGLAVAEGIIKDHGGVILARNRQDGGSVFEIMLPVGGRTAATLGGDD